MPDIENSRKTAEKGAGWVTVNQPKNSQEKRPKHPTKKNQSGCFFGWFDCFFRLFSSCFTVTHPAPFSAVFWLFSMSGIWHLCRWPQRLQHQGPRKEDQGPAACWSSGMGARETIAMTQAGRSRQEADSVRRTPLCVWGWGVSSALGLSRASHGHRMRWQQWRHYHYLDWKKGKDPHPQDKIQHLDLTKDPGRFTTRPLPV